MKTFCSRAVSLLIVALAASAVAAQPQQPTTGTSGSPYQGTLQGVGYSLVLPSGWHVTTASSASNPHDLFTNSPARIPILDETAVFAGVYLLPPGTSLAGGDVATFIQQKIDGDPADSAKENAARTKVSRGREGPSGSGSARFDGTTTNDGDKWSFYALAVQTAGGRVILCHIEGPTPVVGRIKDQVDAMLAGFR